MDTTIKTDNLKPVQPLDIASTITTPTDNGSNLVAGATSSVNQFQTDYQKYLDMTKNDSSTQIQDLIKGLDLGSLTGRGDAQLVAEQNAGIPQFNKDLADVNSQILEKTAAYNKINADLEAGTKGTGNTDIRASMLFGQQAAVNRQAASEIGLLQAKALGLQGQYQNALETANRAVDLKYQDAEAVINTKLKQLELIQPLLTAEDKKRSDALNYALTKEATTLADKKQTEKDIQGIALKLSDFGVDPSIIKGATTVNEALQMAGKNLVDPKQKYEIAKLKADTEKTQLETYYFKKYGGLTPEQYNAQITAQQKAVVANTVAEKTAKEDAILLDTSINQIDAVLNSSALNSVVGSNPFSRGIARQKGFLSGALSAITSLGTSGIGAEITGKADDTVALTQQMLDQQFLDKLIAVKSKGATFGALSDNEGNALRNAANAIAATAIKIGSNEKGNLKVIGYDMSESEFKKQMGIIQDTMRRAREKATEQMFSTDEQNTLDSVFGSDTAISADSIDYSQYYK